jgi:hypothetical protein
VYPRLVLNSLSSCLHHLSAGIFVLVSASFFLVLVIFISFLNLLLQKECMFVFKSEKIICFNKESINPVLMAQSVIVAIQEAEIRRITLQSQPRQIVLDPISKKPITEKERWNG